MILHYNESILMATWLTDHSTCLTYISVLKKRDGSLIMMVSYKYVLLIEESYHWHFLEASAPGAPVTVSSTTVPVPEAGDETTFSISMASKWVEMEGGLPFIRQPWRRRASLHHVWRYCKWQWLDDFDFFVVLRVVKPGVWFLCVPEMRTRS